MSRKRQPGGPIPERWLKCPRKANHFIVDKFLPMKVPLCEAFDHQVPAEYVFSVGMLFDYCKTKKHNLGMWIDLTNTSRFYNVDDIKRNDCGYVKLRCKGHGEAPADDQVRTFINLVENFISKNPLKKIAVHCTHGFNRTGFMIISYLVTKMDFQLVVALREFAKARPPGIYKQDYIDELYRRYPEEDEIISAPSLPDWCFEESEGSSKKRTHEEAFESVPNSDDSSPSVGKRRKTAVFMEGVRGVISFTEPEAARRQKQIQNMCGWKSKGFPGSQPVSMGFENISLLKKPYRVSWKADGMRYLMLIDGPDKIFFFDRDNNVFKVSGIRFPFRKDLTSDISNTLVDGEMVIDKVNGVDIPRYLIYDVVTFNGINVAERPFYPDRTQFIDYEIIRPRHEAIMKGLINKELEPFSIRMKQFWAVDQAENLLGAKFAASLSHEPDGLIFQPSKEPYVPGTCESVLKWKPIELNSVDFLMKIGEHSGAGVITKKVCHLYVGQLDQPFAAMKFKNALKQYDKKIIECKLENKEWKFMRERTDKSFPNSYKTAFAVCESIKNPVTKRDLLHYIEENRYMDDSEKMPPPSRH